MLRYRYASKKAGKFCVFFSLSKGEKKERDKYIDAGRSPTLFKWRCGFWFGGSGDREAPSIEEGGVVCNMAWHSFTMLPGPCSLFFQTCRAISQGCAPVLLS